MNDKDYSITMAITGLILCASLIYLSQTTDAFSAANNSVSQEIKIPEFEAIPEQSIDCRICHKTPETLIKHTLGGNYCSDCHGTELHDLHKIENGHECKKCHGNEEKIPQKLSGHTAVCDSCHGYPDPLSPSYGNLITIHIERGKTCDICHIQDIESLHRI